MGAGKIEIVTLEPRIQNLTIKDMLYQPEIFSWTYFLIFLLEFSEFLTGGSQGITPERYGIWTLNFNLFEPNLKVKVDEPWA